MDGLTGRCPPSAPRGFGRVTAGGGSVSRLIPVAGCLALGVCVLLTSSLRAQDPGRDQAASVAALAAREDVAPDLRQRLRLAQLIAEARAQAGLAPLVLDERLMAAAQEHSTDMASMGRCRHGGSDGSSARTRMGRHGYGFNNWAGENILCARRTPEAALKWWLGSSPHRRNLLHPHFTHLGIGYDPNGPYGPMWTLNFAAGETAAVTPAFLAAAPAGAQGSTASD
jgi:uncharacterized protein YkwD